MTLPTSDIDLPPDHLLRQLIDTIAAHPEVREPLLRVLLTEDFLALPKRVDKLQGEFEEFREETRAGFRAVNERIDGTNTEVRTLSQRLDETNTEVRTLSQRLDETNTEVRTLSQRLDDTNAEVRTLSQRLDGTNAEVRTLSSEVRTLGHRMDENTRAIRRLEGRVGRLTGQAYEDKCRYNIGVILDGWLDGPVVADRAQINAKLLDARRNGSISREEYQHGLNPDIIACGVEDTGQTALLAVVEASVTFNQDDLETAARRAAVIAKVTGTRTAAFMATHFEWPDEVNSVARQLGVTIIRFEDPESEAPE